MSSQLVNPHAEHPKKQQHIIILLAFLALWILVGIWLYTSNSTPPADDVGLSSYNSPNNTKLVADDPASKILLVSIATTNSSSKPFAITSITQYNARADTPDATKKQYLLEVVEAGSRVYASYFAVPVVIGESFDSNGTIKRAESNQATSLTFRIPRVKDGSSIMVRNSNGDVVFQDTVKNVKVVNNKPDYQSVAGEDVQDN